MSLKKVTKAEKDWKKELTDAQYTILRKKGTERPFTGAYNMHFENGIYHCAACQNPLFESHTKFDAGCGWPSFDASIKRNITYILDKSHGMMRTEIVCSSCDGHLGHVFNDGPTDTGTRYCVNSLSLDFKKS